MTYRPTPFPNTLFLSNRILEISQNEAQSCYEVANYFENRGSRLLQSFTILVSNVRKKAMFPI